MGDDGLGLAALERLRMEGVAADVELVDGGTWGLTLLPIIESAARVLFLDAIEPYALGLTMFLVLAGAAVVLSPLLRVTYHLILAVAGEPFAYNFGRFMGWFL